MICRCRRLQLLLMVCLVCGVVISAAADAQQEQQRRELASAMQALEQLNADKVIRQPLWPRLWSTLNKKYPFARLMWMWRAGYE